MLEAMVFDRRVQVAIDGRLLFEPYDFDDPAAPGVASDSPISLGVRGGACRKSPICGFIATFTTRARWPARRAILTGCPRPSSWDRMSTLCWATIARFPTIRGSGMNARSCAVRCSSGGRFWCICPGRLFRSRFLVGRCAGFPIRGESVTFGSRVESARRGVLDDGIAVERPGGANDMVKIGSQSSSSLVSSRRGNI